MPELPEVETVVQGLRPHLEGLEIDQLELRRPDMRFPFPEGFAESVSGRTVIQIRRRSKYILMDLSDDLTLIAHLGMSGRMLINPEELDKHDHVIFKTAKSQIHFRDPRRFGFLLSAQTSKLSHHPLLKDIGVEPLTSQFDARCLFDLSRDRQVSLKSFLLNQKYIAGLGNIYVCEALHLSSLHPEKLASTLKRDQATLLTANIKLVLEKAIASGGSSLKDHRQVSGNLGYFQHQFTVYGREGEACTTCGPEKEIVRMVQNGRSTFYCKACQHKR